MPAGHLQDAARAQQREQRRRDDRRRPVPHRCYPAMQARPCSTGRESERARGGGTEQVEEVRSACLGHGRYALVIE
jgi:hypothetical protein